MELTNDFEVAVPVEAAWALLTDVERIAPCLPGAELSEVEADEYRGSVKVKVGPITTSYQGVARFTELDESAHRAVLKAEGRESRGQGNAAAVITATMAPSGAGTRVTVSTDLAISGKVAQFGRGVMADVAAKLLDQFVANLEAMVLAPGAPDATKNAPEGADAPDGVRRITSSPAEPVDLAAVAGSSVVRRVMRPLAVVGVLSVLALRARRRRRSRPD
jgi:carbon monoxide dehydrogenase subunit G